MQVPDSTFGRDEQTESAPFVQFFNPSDFDVAYEALRLQLKQDLGFGDEITYLGIFGGTLKDFLKRYIDTAHALGVYYTGGTEGEFFNYMIQNYRYSEEKLNVYFDALIRLINQGKIPESIAKPSKYEQDMEKPIVKLAKVGFKYVIIAGVVYVGWQHVLKRFV